MGGKQWLQDLIVTKICVWQKTLSWNFLKSSLEVNRAAESGDI